MSRRRSAEAPAPNATAAQRRRTANDAVSLVIPVRTTVKIGAHELLKLNPWHPKAPVQDAGENEERP